MRKNLTNMENKLYCHNSGVSIYDMDYDGMGNQGRCPKPKSITSNRILTSLKDSLDKIKKHLTL